MQFNVTKTEPPKKFDPIEVKFTLESKEELEFFMAYFNASGNDQAEFANTHMPSCIDKKFTSQNSFVKSHGMWRQLEDVYNKL
jgi:hypothetical protein